MNPEIPVCSVASVAEAIWQSKEKGGALVEFPNSTKMDRDILRWLSEDSDEVWVDDLNVIQVTVKIRSQIGQPSYARVRFWMPLSLTSALNGG